MIPPKEYIGRTAQDLILFDGGLNTPLSAIRPASVLATVGVVATAALMGLAANLLFRFPWPVALLLGPLSTPRTRRRSSPCCAAAGCASS